jgi:hypothetical protein
MEYISKISSSVIIFIYHVIGLIFNPYKTMRKIASENDKNQLIIIFGLVYMYFIYANIIRARTLYPFIISTKISLNVLFFTITFILTTGFFYAISRKFNGNISYKHFIYCFAYSILPTYIWFFSTSTLYLFFPPPRTTSILGLVLSAIFIIFSSTLLFWKINLYYLALRFSSKTNFYQIILMTITFLLWFIPFSYLIYKLKIFRIPFI